MGGKEEIIQTLRDSKDLYTSYSEIVNICFCLSESELIETLNILVQKNIIKWDKVSNMLSLVSRDPINEENGKVHDNVAKANLERLLEQAKLDNDVDMINHLSNLLEDYS